MRLLLSCTLILLIAAGGCKSSEPPLITEGKAFSLREKGEVRLRPDLGLRFIELLNDSRCPRGQLCAMDGQVSLHMAFTYPDGHTNAFLIEGYVDPNGREQYARTVHYGFRITVIRVDPYPEYRPARLENPLLTSATLIVEKI